MKTAQVDFQFPLIGFTPDKDVWGFPDRDALTTSGPGSIKEGKPIGMELVDNGGRRWKVLSVTRVGRKGALIPWALGALLSTPQHRIDYELEAMPAITMAEVKARASAGVEAFPLYWAEPSEVETELPAFIAKVEAADSVAELFDLIGLDWFAAY
jgi:hypothetical protein